MPVFNKLSSDSGFALMEIIVTLIVFGLITIVAIPNLKTFGEGQEAKNEVIELVSAIRQAQTNAQNGVKCNDTASADFWQVVFDSATRYTLEVYCEDGSKGSFSKQSTFLKSTTQETICGAGKYGSDIHIRFSSITAGSSRVIFPMTDQCPLVSPFNITLKSLNTNDIYTVTIEQGGAITTN